MRRLTSWTAVVVLLSGTLLAVNAPQAHAAEDSITRMLVHYDIQTDGTVLVEHQIDWKFGSEGRHGINHSIRTRESWDNDAGKDVVYDVSNIRVDSPSGAPDQFTEDTNGLGSDERIDLRIGNPDVTIEGREATYVISYELKGALRTFDQTPEFYWDVTSINNPQVEQFEVRITAPEGVTRGRCLAGKSECEATVVGGGAVLAGERIEQGEVLSVVAELPPGSVVDAEPQLEERRINIPELQEVVSAVEVRPSGIVHVEQELTYRLPLDYAEYQAHVFLEIPVRRPFSAEQDRLFRITDVEVAGAHDVEVSEPRASSLDRSSQDMTVRIDFEQVSETTVVVLSYDVAGAVVTDQDSSRVSWLVLPESSHTDPALDFTWAFPTPIQQVSCSRVQGEFSEEPDPCDLDLVMGDRAVTWNPGADGGSLRPWAWVVAEVEPLDGSGAQPILEPGLDAAARRTERLTFAGAAAAALIFAGGTLLAGWVALRRSSRWADVPPGVTAEPGARTRPTVRGDIVPVRFHEPEASLWLAGLVWDRHSDTRHTMAGLVQLATLGAIQLRASPLEVTQLSDADLDDSLQRDLWELADSESEASVLLQRMNQAVMDEQEQLLKNRSLFQEPKPGAELRRFLVWLPLLLSIAVLAINAVFAPGWFGPHGQWVIVGAFLGAFVAGFFARRMRLRTPLAPAGTALRDQVEGFRTYIATAEANQLRVEADADVYRRYLPWAVLFDLTDRWSSVCQDLADAGKIPQPDTSFFTGADSAMIVSAGLSSLVHKVPSAQSSSTLASSSVLGGGGSGGSSGFSGGSSGGGGGGGTSSSSW